MWDDAARPLYTPYTHSHPHTQIQPTSRGPHTPSNLIFGDCFGGIAVPPFPQHHCLVALVNHAQVGVEGDAHASVVLDLKGRAHVLGAHGGHELLGIDGLNDLGGQRVPVRDLSR